ncbi:hypothetical protein NDN08_005456 [Rhodosorus marinus]|uniref:2-dehydropantoate 2-reductase n=1 Tax=Rhodosorus marinus TaxID=101924 RepID=A0AAV8V1N9_9RHOD|nr:hypothetical protein NDN08_005456 [Rhodosorus marinus]
MRVCVVGAGSIGGFLAVKLAQSGNDVTVTARGKHLEAIKKHGLLLKIGGEELLASNLKATDKLRDVGEQDVFFLAVKAHQVEPIVDDISAVLGPKSCIVTLQNGIPWWFFQEFNGPFSGTVVRSVDPDGTLSKKIDPKRIIGCVVYPAANIEAPGVIRHDEGIRFPIGELDGSSSERVQAISNMLVEAGFKSPILPDIRSELFLKVWGSACFNPVSALTHATLEDLCTYPLTRELSINALREIQAVGEKLGATFRVPLQRRLDGAKAVGQHKTSTLQDVENGREMEIDAIGGAVVELAKIAGVDIPHVETIYALSKLLNENVRAGNMIRSQPKAA